MIIVKVNRRNLKQLDTVRLTCDGGGRQKQQADSNSRPSRGDGAWARVMSAICSSSFVNSLMSRCCHADVVSSGDVIFL